MTTEHLQALDPRDAAGEELRAMRVRAGLSLYQAAAKLGMPTHRLGDIEFNRGRPTDEQYAVMRVIYGVKE